ncbi:MAG: MFS transporter [Bacteroidales bacterium]|nr:MFS transporter [Bacteroidales bacterium]
MSKSSLTNRKYLVPFILITTLFFLWGFARSMLDVLNQHFKDTLNISIGQSSLVQVCSYLAYFMMALPAGIFISRYGYRRGVVFGLLLFAVGAFIFIPGARMEAFSVYLGALFVIACGLAFLETAANPYSTMLGPKETATSRLNLSQSFNGLGSSLGPLIMGGYLFSQADADLSLPYAVMGIVVMIVAVIFSRVNLPEIQVEEEPTDTEAPKNALKTLMSNGLFVFGLLALLAYEVSEISINSYFVLFVTGMGWLKADGASYILGLSLFIFMGGRFLGSWIMRSVKPARMLSWCAAGSLLSILMVILTSSSMQNEVSWTRYLPIVFLMVNYLCESIMFPTIYSMALNDVAPRLVGRAGSVLMMTPVGGCAFLLMGIMADNIGYVLPFFLPLLGFVVVLAYAIRKRMGDK